MIGFKKKILIWDKHEKKYVLGPESFFGKKWQFSRQKFWRKYLNRNLIRKRKKRGKIHKSAFEGNILGGKIYNSYFFYNGGEKTTTFFSKPWKWHFFHEEFNDG